MWVVVNKSDVNVIKDTNKYNNNYYSALPEYVISVWQVANSPSMTGEVFLIWWIYLTLSSLL